MTGASMVITTVCTRNYLPRVRVLAGSLLDHAPDARVHALVLDARPGDPAEPLFDVVMAEDVIEPAEFARMATAYDLVELSTALKPTLLRHLLTRHEAVHFVDPDIRFHADPGFLDELARTHGIVLTPHLTRPPRRERGGSPGGEDVVLPAGVFNLGYLGVSRKADPGFLPWWEDRLARDCLNDTASARFVDQRWMDLVPGYFPHHIETHPGVNLAWWNMPDREVSRPNGQWLADGRPLVFLHASGVDPSSPYRLSRHHDDAHAFQPAEGSPLRTLMDDYCAAVRAAGQGALPPPEPGLRRVDGLHITREERRRYRADLLRHEIDGSDEPPNPFTHGLPRFTRWLDTCRGAAARPPVAPRARGAGVNLVGRFSSPSGVGMVARLMASALSAADVPYATHDLDARSGGLAGAVPWVDKPGGLFDTTIMCVNADEAHSANHRVPTALRECRRIGIWWWETEDFPNRFADAFHVVDEVWTGSDFTRRAIATLADRPVRVIPMPITVEDRPDVGLRARLGVPDTTFMVASVLSLDSIFERKNPLGAIAAYRRAFSPGDATALVLKVTGTDDGTRIEQLRHAAHGRSDVHIINATLPIEAVHGLISSSDCLLSLHRSEGFGLTIAEAMAYGRPVVATGYGGNMQFTDSSCAYVVPWAYTSVSRDAQPYAEGALWAEPDLNAAAALLREVRDDPAGAAERATAGRARIMRDHSPEHVGSTISAVLERSRTNSRRRWLPLLRGRHNGAASRADITTTRAADGPATGFYHSMDLPGGHRVLGDWSILDMDSYLGMVPMRGRRVIDVGTATGALAFAAEARGAREVVALDLPLGADDDARVPVSAERREGARAWRRAVREGFHACHAALGSSVRHTTGDVRALRTDLGRFDIGILGNVLQHLRDPAGALLSVAAMCNVLVVTEADWMHGQAPDDLAALIAFDTDQPYWWFQARPRWVTDLLARNDFEDITVSHHVQRYNGHAWPDGATRSDPVDIPHFTVVAWHRDVPAADRRWAGSSALRHQATTART